MGDFVLPENSEQPSKVTEDIPEVTAGLWSNWLMQEWSLLQKIIVVLIYIFRDFKYMFRLHR